MKNTAPSVNEFVTLSTQLIAEKDPGSAAALAEQLWRTTYRSQIADSERALLASAHQETLRYGSGVLNTYTWGTGTPVLLLHGWNGRAGQMAEIAIAMAEAGFKATALDFPAHGESSGHETDVLEMISAIQHLNQVKGAFHSVITHSFGSVGLLQAVLQGMRVDRVVCVSAPADIETLLDKFTSLLKLSDQVISLLKKRLEKTYGVEFWRTYSVQEMSRQMTMPGLLIHDSDDEYIGIGHMFEINAAWQASDILSTQGLGHNKILNDPSVIRAITQFCCAE
ncbi:MAG: alpha/beta hydrolase [Gammaproteobacteria bacterium]